VALRLIAVEGIQACLVRGQNQPVIDSQSLAPGSSTGPFQGATRYRLDLESGGKARLVVNGRSAVVRSRRPASFAISSAGPHEVPFKGPRCP
jgi:hypothetical protein